MPLPEFGRVVVLGRRDEHTERLLDAGDLLRRHRGDRTADNLALDHASQVVEPAEILEIDAGRDGRALRQGDDHPLGFEPPERFADRNVADAERLLEFGDSDPLTRLDLSGKQRPAKPLSHVVDQTDALDSVVADGFHGA